MLKYAILFSTMVLTVVAKLGPYSGKTGYFATSFYYSDSKCQSTPVSSNFAPIGDCFNQTYSQSYKASTMYTTDPSNNNKVYQTNWQGTGSCNSGGPFSNSTFAVFINSTCVRNQYNSNGNQPYMKQQIGFVATLPIVAYPQYMQTNYGVGGCAIGVVTYISISTMYLSDFGSYNCYSSPQCTSTQYGSISTCPMPTGTLATGYASTANFNGVPCTAANNANQGGTQFMKLGACDPLTSQASPGQSTPQWSSSKITAYTSGSTTVFVQSYFQTTNCGGSTQSYNYFVAGNCPTTWTKSYSFTQYSLVSALPPAPAGGMSAFDYATPAACAATDPTQIVSAYYVPGGFLPANYTQTTKCYNLNGAGPAQMRTLCGPQTFTSTTGGFFVSKIYGDSACATPPIGLQFYQANICFVNNATTSTKFTIATNANGVTVATQLGYRNTACTGTPLITMPNFKNTTQICKGSGTTDNGVTNQWSTSTFTSVLGINAGFILAAYSTASACAAQTQASLVYGYQVLSNTCGQNSGRNNSLIVVNTCGVPTAAAVLQVVYVSQTISSASLTLTTVQSPAFQSTFKQAVATTAGVAASAVQVHHPTIPLVTPYQIGLSSLLLNRTF